MEDMRSKIEEALKLIDIAKKLEEKIVSVQHRQDVMEGENSLHSSAGGVFLEHFTFPFPGGFSYENFDPLCAQFQFACVC